MLKTYFHQQLLPPDSLKGEALRASFAKEKVPFRGFRGYWTLKNCIYVLLFILYFTPASAYSDKKAILVVNRNLQRDSIGYNIADDISRVVYDGILSGQIKLWGSPEKKDIISVADLKEKEKTSGCRFKSQRNLFIYEEWSVENKKYKFLTRGFSFTGKDSNRKDVFFGYVDMNESTRKIMEESLANVNADGYYGTTILQELQSRNFEFDLVFFDKKTIRNIKKSQKIIREANAAKNIIFRSDIPKIKLVEYSIEPGPSILSEKSGEIIKSLQTFFNENPQEFYNSGGDRMFSYMRKSPVIVSTISVTETWTKSNDSLHIIPVQYVPYVVGMPLDPIFPQQFTDWKVKYNGADFTKEIIKKDFYYRISGINSTRISEKDSEAAKQILLGRDWHNISRALNTGELAKTH